MSVLKLVICTAIACACLTALYFAVPELSRITRNDDLNLVFALSQAMIGLLASYLALGRLRRRRRLDHLLLGAGLAVLAVSSLLFSVGPAVASDGDVPWATWAAAAGRLAGAGLLASAALVSPRRLQLTTRQFFFASLAVVDGLALILACALVFRDELPPPIVDGDLNGALAAFLGLALVAHLCTAVAFAARAKDARDPLRSAVAVGSVLGAASLAIYLVEPITLTDYVGLGDVMRFGFYVAVLAGVLGEMEAQARSSAERAALDERRRIAGDLHDGLAQELASIQRNLRWLESDDPFVARALAGAERGLAAARRGIDILGDAPEADFSTELAERVAVVAGREGADVSFDLDPRVTVGPAERAALVQIAAEAVTNAVRHGGADVVRVELVRRPRVRMRVSDSGRGFNAGLVNWSGGNGFGLADMRDRATEIGARYGLTSEPGRGTTVEVVL